MQSEDVRPLLVCGAIVFVGLCKVVYNGLLAAEDEQFSDSVIAKTLVLCLLSAVLSYYVFKYYKKVNIPGQSKPAFQPPSSPSTLVSSPILNTTSRRISSLVPTQSSAFVTSS